MKNIHTLFLLTTLVCCTTVAQEAPSDNGTDGRRKAVSAKLYGFVRNYFNYDSRKTYTVIGGEYNMIPYDNKWNADKSDDLNQVPHAQLQALTTRIGLNLEGPDLLGMKSSGKIEADFGGFGTTNSVLRLRQAFVKLSKSGDGKTCEVLLGQTWHPLSGDIMPEVLGMAAGAPFRPHSRTPQLRAISYWNNFGITAALLYQLQYMNNGPVSATDPSSTNSIDFARNAIVPECFLSLNYKSSAFYAQMGVDAQLIRPRTHAVNALGVVKRVDETVFSLTPTLYAQYVEGMISVKFRTLLAQNTSHLNQLVGYAVTDASPEGQWSYTPLSASISYLNIAYGKQWRCNLFLGYMQNMGAAKDLYDFSANPATPLYRIYMKGGEEFTHLNSVWRIAPSVSYNVKAFNIGLEYELTGASYGDIATDGSIQNTDALHQVVNHRICALVKYNF